VLDGGIASKDVDIGMSDTSKFILGKDRLQKGSSVLQTSIPTVPGFGAKTHGTAIASPVHRLSAEGAAAVPGQPHEHRTNVSSTASVPMEVIFPRVHGVLIVHNMFEIVPDGRPQNWLGNVLKCTGLSLLAGNGKADPNCSKSQPSDCKPGGQRDFCGSVTE